MLVHPVNGRRIPIIQDAELVDMSFGTGGWAGTDRIAAIASKSTAQLSTAQHSLRGPFFASQETAPHSHLLSHHPFSL
jgi:hypothetical protein